jgi:hypothetical protein
MAHPQVAPHGELEPLREQPAGATIDADLKAVDPPGPNSGD